VIGQTADAPVHLNEELVPSEMVAVSQAKSPKHDTSQCPIPQFSEVITPLHDPAPPQAYETPRVSVVRKLASKHDDSPLQRTAKSWFTGPITFTPSHAVVPQLRLQLKFRGHSNMVPWHDPGDVHWNVQGLVPLQAQLAPLQYTTSLGTTSTREGAGVLAGLNTVVTGAGVHWVWHWQVSGFSVYG